MLLLAGLGNPGPRYADNRHNIGFMAVDEIVRRHSFSPWRNRFQADCAEGRLGGEKVLVLKPQTYMNESGRAVGEALRFFKLAPEDVIVLYDEIDLAPGKIRVKQGGGTGGSRSLLMGGMALDGAADKVIERSRKVAGHLLEAAEADIEFQEGVFTVAGTDKTVTLTEVAKAAYGDAALPDEMKEPLEDQHHIVAGAQTYPNGSHLCELEADPDTGVVKLLRYVVVDDFGTLVNPLLAAGQVHGGTVQGIGQALLEHTVYDADGQLLTGSFMDYTMPRADDIPQIELTMIEDTPCTTNPMGVKGAGEAGAIGSCPAVINALVDALAPLGIRHVDMPATPEKVWRAIQDASRREAAE